MLPVKIIFMIFITINGFECTKTVTTEDIRNAILSVVHMIRSSEDKLERHEYRERVLGEQVKKALGAIEKRQRIIEPVKGTTSRIDERLANVETILMQKDERERIQLQKAFGAIQDIQNSLPKIIDNMKNEILAKLQAKEPEATPEPVDVVTRADFESFEKDIIAKVDHISKNVDSIQHQLGKMQSNNTILKEIQIKSADNLQSVEQHLNKSEQLLDKYENKLEEFNNRILPTITLPQQTEQNDWQTSIKQAIEVLRTNLELVLSDVKSITGKLQKLPEKIELETNNNSTLDALEHIKHEVGSATAKVGTIIDEKFKTAQKDADQKHNDINKVVSDVVEMMDSLNGNFANSYEQLKAEIATLGKLEQVVVQTADGVLDTKRRVEYGVHQILLEVGDLVKVHAKEINTAINDRFDNFELSILDNDNGALANLTSKIGQEIDQVWRQIGIMHQQMSASTDTLNKLQNQTDVYVNGSLTTMDKMRGKVVQITTRMSEVDDNLNYLLGRLGLITQEFNDIKTGLSSALDQIKSSFMAVKDKIQDAGPGRHKIPEDTFEENE